MITAGANRKTSVLAPALLSNPPRKPLIRNWLAKRPRWHIHLTPTSSSWLDQVERSVGVEFARYSANAPSVANVA